MTTYNEFGGYGHPDHIRTHDVGGPRVRAGRRPGLVSGAARAGARRHGPSRDEGGLAPWAPSKLYEQAIPASVRKAMPSGSRSSARRSFWEPPEDATPEQIAEFEALRREDARPRRVDHDLGRHLGRAARRASGRAIHEHVTQISDQSPFMLLGLDGWREFWAKEAYILRESRVATSTPETDLFAGIV